MYTKISEGVFQHSQTGFFLHEIYSIDDAIHANGVLAVDHLAGVWGWVAGYDLRMEIKKFGALSLRALAENVLREYIVYPGGISGGAMAPVSLWGGVNTIDLSIPGIKFGDPCSASDLRIFGLITDLAGGRGTHPSRISFSNIDAANSIMLHHFVDLSVYGDPGALDTSDTYPFEPQQIHIGAATCLQDGALGRGLISVPFGTWEGLASAWVDALPDSDRPEMRDKGAAAVAKVGLDNLRAKLGIVPIVKAPFTLELQGGKTRAMFEPNVKPVGMHGFNAGKPVLINYPAYAIPALREAVSGLWVTNPLHVTSGGRTLPSAMKHSSTGIWSTFERPVNHATTTSNVTPATTAPASVGGVELMKILGDLHPHVLPAGDRSSSALAQTLFEDALTDRVAPTQGGEESDADYKTRLESSYATTKVGLGFLPGCWAFAGQPAKIACTLFEDGLHDDSRLTVAEGGLHSSGYYSGFLRQPSTGSLIKVPRSTLRATTFDVSDIQPVTG